jgi:glycosyltransferase involved in cell wall biosynthesis
MPRAESSLLPSTIEDIAVLIPAWQPDLALPALVAKLVERGFPAVIVVDDGSQSCDPIFAALHAFDSVQVSRHAVNLGKGRALKTGFNHILVHLPLVQGVVTADADGQHTVDGIVDVALALNASRGRFVLGCRTFSTDVPLRSRFGNVLTRRIFSFVTGTKISDTQTGLRGFPRDLLPELLLLDGEKYEYEMTVLAHLCRNGKKPVEVPIETI